MRHAQVPWVEANPSPEGITVHCTVCGALATVATPQQANQIALQHQEHQSPAPGHYGAGDAIARATKALGIEPCTPCEKRRQQLNGLLPRVWPRRR